MRNLTVKQIMSTDLITVTPDDSLLTVTILIKDKKVRQIPVVTSDNKITGIITDRNIREILGKNYSTETEHNSEHLKEKVEKYMTKYPVTISPDTPLGDAIQIINTKKFGSLPVCEDDNSLVGIVTVTDISGLLLKLLQNET